MADMKDRRKRGRPSPKESPLRVELDAAKEAGVPKKELAEVLSKRFRSAAAQKAAMRRLRNKYGGTHAGQLTEFQKKK